MKARWISIPAVALTIIGAGHALADETPTSEALAKKYECMECHSVDKVGVGPSYKDIAARYKNTSHARDLMIAAIKNGTKSKWLGVAKGVVMPPYSNRVPGGDIERLADWILSF